MTGGIVLVGLTLLSGTALIIIIVINTLMLSGEHRAGLLYVGGLAVRYTYWVGFDGTQLREALVSAITCLSQVWPPAFICVALDGMHIDVAGDTWVDTPERLRFIPQPSHREHSRMVLVDLRLRFLAHELAHVIERHSGRGPRGRGDVHHHHWLERGVFDALKRYERELQRLEGNQ